MTAIAATAAFPARPGADRAAFLTLILLVWIAVLSGFGTDAYSHIAKHGLDYPPIVHVHAAAFLGYLALFTGQVLLIRGGRADLHRSMGAGIALLAAAMVVIGPATAITVAAKQFAANGDTPEFFAVQF